MKIQDHIQPAESGWYQAENSSQFHFFNQEGAPLCGKTIRGFDLFVGRFGSRINEVHPNRFNGYCPRCIAKKQFKEIRRPTVGMTYSMRIPLLYAGAVISWKTGDFLCVKHNGRGKYIFRHTENGVEKLWNVYEFSKYIKK